MSPDQKDVVGEQFTRAWINLAEFPGGMMVSNGERYGPCPAMTSCLITTSERQAKEWAAKGPVLEIFTRAGLEWAHG